MSLIGTNSTRKVALDSLDLLVKLAVSRLGLLKFLVLSLGINLQIVVSNLDLLIDCRISRLDVLNLGSKFALLPTDIIHISL